MAFKVPEEDVAVPSMPNHLRKGLCSPFFATSVNPKIRPTTEDHIMNPSAVHLKELLSRCIQPSLCVCWSHCRRPHLVPLTCEQWQSSLPCPILFFYVWDCSPWSTQRGMVPRSGHRSLGVTFWTRVWWRASTIISWTGWGSTELDREKQKHKLEPGARKTSAGSQHTDLYSWIVSWLMKRILYASISHNRVPWLLLQHSKLHFLFSIPVNGMAIGVSLLILAALVDNVNSRWCLQLQKPIFGQCNVVWVTGLGSSTIQSSDQPSDYRDMEYHLAGGRSLSLCKRLRGTG